MNNADVHSVLVLHRHRTAELSAEVERERLAARVPRRIRRWWRSP